jgi:hypothetical protein
VNHEAEQLCMELERLAADRRQILDTCRSLNLMEQRICSRMEAMEQELLDLLNVDDSESLDIQDIGHLRIILQRKDQYNSKPYFEVRYPDYMGVYTRAHYLRKPGQKRRSKKGA